MVYVLVYVFKIVVDFYFGKMGVMCVYQGCVVKGGLFFVGYVCKFICVGYFFMLQGVKYVDIDEVLFGDFCVIVKVDDLVFDVVLYDVQEDEYIFLKFLDYLMFVYGLVISLV